MFFLYGRTAPVRRGMEGAVTGVTGEGRGDVSPPPAPLPPPARPHGSEGSEAAGVSQAHMANYGFRERTVFDMNFH